MQQNKREEPCADAIGIPQTKRSCHGDGEKEVTPKVLRVKANRPPTECAKWIGGKVVCCAKLSENTDKGHCWIYVPLTHRFVAISTTIKNLGEDIKQLEASDVITSAAALHTIGNHSVHSVFRDMLALVPAPPGNCNEVIPISRDTGKSVYIVPIPFGSSRALVDMLAIVGMVCRATVGTGSRADIMRTPKAILDDIERWAAPMSPERIIASSVAADYADVVFPAPIAQCDHPTSQNNKSLLWLHSYLFMRRILALVATVPPSKQVQVLRDWIEKVTHIKYPTKEGAVSATAAVASIITGTSSSIQSST
jgi:hypothetical protein